MLLLAPYVRARGLGRALTSPAHIELESGSVLQPDIFVTPLFEPAGEEFTWKEVTSLLLAVEINSPSSIRTDRVEKRDQYMKMAVDEYWVVDIEGSHVERWRRGRPDVEVAREELVWSPAGASQSLTIEVPELFRAIRAYPR
jgi:Uma2 family endonuclease